MSPTASATPLPVLEAARHLAQTSNRAGTDIDDTIRILRAIWPDGTDHILTAASGSQRVSTKSSESSEQDS